MSIGAAYAAGIAAWAAVVGAAMLQRAQARSVVAQYPADIRSRPDFRDRYGVLEEPWHAGEHFLSLARAGWTVFFVAFFLVLGLANFELGLLLTIAAASGVVFTARWYPARRREEDAYARRVGIEAQAGRLENARVRTTYAVLTYGQAVLWLVGCAFVAFATAQIIA